MEAKWDPELPLLAPARLRKAPKAKKPPPAPSWIERRRHEEREYQRLIAEIRRDLNAEARP